MNKIEFIKGEPFCRYNGILCDSEGCTKIYGYPEDICMLDNTTIIHEDTLYTNHDLFTVIKLISDYQGETPEYDEIIDEGRGFASHCEHIKYDNTYIIGENMLEDFKDVKQIKPFSSFKKDHPEISIKKYLKFQDALDKYYADLQYE